MKIRCIRALLFAAVILAASASFAQVRVSISFGPPPLPVYEQPVCPGDDYLWTPGYWAYDYDYNDYYWVPGTWVLAPQPDVFWTPGYWGWGGESFVFHEGYWGPHVGFYGGINYGYGYFGDGYEGGRWDRGHFFYNRSVNNVNVTRIHNVYNTTIINKTTVINRVSYNGGNGGINMRPRPDEEMAERDHHIPPIAAQAQHMREARSDPQQRASTNHGRPDVAATPKPSDFKDHGVVRASQAGGNYNPPPNRNNQPNRPGNDNVPRPDHVVHAKDIPQGERHAPPSTGDAKRDQKYQQQQQKLYTKQDNDRQKLEQKQDRDHQRAQQPQANQTKQQQLEQHHQQQTQKLQQKQQQQVQKMQSRQQPSPRQSQAGKPQH
jgi:hypothetical protein